MKKIAGFIYDHSRLIIAFVAIGNLVSLASFFRFNLDTDFLAFFSEGNPKAEAYNQLNAKYQSGETISILVEDDYLLEKDKLLDILGLQNEIGVVNGVARVQSFVPPEIMAGGGITSVDEAYIEEHYDTLVDFIENKYFLAEQILAEDGHSAAIIVGLALDAPAGATTAPVVMRRKSGESSVRRLVESTLTMACPLPSAAGPDATSPKSGAMAKSRPEKAAMARPSLPA